MFYRCRGGGNCKVNIKIKGQRTCQSCRYERCLQAGMRPELVLSQSKKEARFKKHWDKHKVKEEEEEEEEENQLEDEGNNGLLAIKVSRIKNI